MPIVYRQDGSQVDLCESDAAAWVKMGLATVPNVTAKVGKDPLETPPATEGE